MITKAINSPSNAFFHSSPPTPTKSSAIVPSSNKFDTYLQNSQNAKTDETYSPQLKPDALLSKLNSSSSPSSASVRSLRTIPDDQKQYYFFSTKALSSHDIESFDKYIRSSSDYSEQEDTFALEDYEFFGLITLGDKTSYFPPAQCFPCDKKSMGRHPKKHAHY